MGCLSFKAKQNQQQQRIQTLEQIIAQRETENNQLANRLEQSGKREQNYIIEIQQLQGEKGKLEQKQQELIQDIEKLQQKILVLEDEQEIQQLTQANQEKEIVKLKNDLKIKSDQLVEYSNQLGNRNYSDQMQQSFIEQIGTSKTQDYNKVKNNQSKQKPRNQSESTLQKTGVQSIMQTTSQFQNTSNVSIITSQDKLKLFYLNTDITLTHNSCKTQAYLTNQGLIICDGNCRQSNSEVNNWYFDLVKYLVICKDEYQQDQNIYKYKMVYSHEILIDLAGACLDKNFTIGQERDDFFDSIKKSQVYKKLEQEAKLRLQQFI